MTGAVHSHTLRGVVAEAGARLRAAGLDSPQLDAELLACHALGLDRVQLRTRSDETLSEQQRQQFDALVERRLAHEPVQYITGVAWFRELELVVDSRVLIPRPETELLVDLALAEIARIADARGSGPARVLDMCTGSGAVALAVADEAPAGSVLVTGVDVSARALEVAAANCERLGLDVELLCGDLFAPVAGRSFELIVANPPYIPRSEQPDLPRSVREHEPHVALFVDGEDHHALIRRIVGGACPLLAPHALLAIEIGLGQDVGAQQVLRDAGLVEVTAHPDLQGLPRIVTGRCAGGS